MRHILTGAGRWEEWSEPPPEARPVARAPLDCPGSWLLMGHGRVGDVIGCRVCRRAGLRHGAGGCRNITALGYTQRNPVFSRVRCEAVPGSVAEAARSHPRSAAQASLALTMAA